MAILLAIKKKIIKTIGYKNSIGSKTKHTFYPFFNQQFCFVKKVIIEVLTNKTAKEVIKSLA